MGNMPCLNTDGTYLAAADLDYNNYYTPTNGNIIAYWGSTSYTTLTGWRTDYAAYNKNSISADPQLISKYNFHLNCIIYQGGNCRYNKRL